MKTAMTYDEMLSEVQRIALASNDLIVATSKLRMSESLDLQVMDRTGEPVYTFGTLDVAHDQIAARNDIPSKYYARMRAQAPDLLAANVNRWFDEKAERRMLRSLDGNVRAFLSDRYRRIDNSQILAATLPVLEKIKHMNVLSCAVTEKKFYLKVSDPSLRQEIKGKRVGDVVEGGVVISNSEVGMGGFSAYPFLNFLVCTNGMVREAQGTKRTHVGRRIEEEGDLAAIMSDQAKRADDKALMLLVRDITAAAFNKVHFAKSIEQLQALTAESALGSRPIDESIEVLAKGFALSEVESDLVMHHFVEGGDTSRYGLVNAVTRTAEDMDDYDRATEIEAIGGRMIDMPRADWKRIAEAA